MGVLWVGFSMFYMSMWFKCCRNLFDENWEKRGQKEIMQWERCHGGYHTYEKVNGVYCEYTGQPLPRSSSSKRKEDQRQLTHAQIMSPSDSGKKFTHSVIPTDPTDYTD